MLREWGLSPVLDDLNTDVTGTDTSAPQYPIPFDPPAPMVSSSNDSKFSPAKRRDRKLGLRSFSPFVRPPASDCSYRSSRYSCPCCCSSAPSSYHVSPWHVRTAQGPNSDFPPPPRHVCEGPAPHPAPGGLGMSGMRGRYLPASQWWYRSSRIKCCHRMATACALPKLSAWRASRDRRDPRRAPRRMR